MGAVAFGSPGSGSFTVPSEVRRIWVSCVGGGGGGNWRYDGLDNAYSAGGGGGGLAQSSAQVSSTNIGFFVGAGGGRSTAGGASGCAGVTAFGGGGGVGGSGGAGGGFTPAGVAGIAGQGGSSMAGGSAGSAAYTPETRVCSIFSSTQPRFGRAGNGGYGAQVTGGSGNPGTVGLLTNCNDTVGGNGGAYGGGGGGAFGAGGGSNPSAGVGAGGALYASWIDLSVPKTTLRSNEPVTVTYNSPVISGSETVSYSNNGTSNITQTYIRTDSRNARSDLTFTILPAARILSFTANPNPQTSGFDGVPNYDVVLSWTTSGATSASITNIGAVSANGSVTVTDLPQSVAGVTSPATRTYTLTISDGFNTDTSSITVSVFNDNTPNDYSIPNQSNLEPNTFYVVDLGPITGIDMVTNVIGGPGVTVSKNNLQNYVSSITIVNNDSVQVRFITDAFNQDPAGLPTTPRSLYIDIGPIRRFFTISTRAPDVNETFNLPDETGFVPYPDIDTISEPSLPYLTSDTLTVDDIELQNPNGVEIKASNPNLQVRKKITGSNTWGPWEDVRSI